MPNAKDTDLTPTKRILMVGPTGSGKSAQIWTLPGRKFAYIFDPNSLSTLKGCDLDYEEFYPDMLELDASLKGFNKNSVSDRMPGKASKREPLVYMKWIDNINKKVEEKFFDAYQWLIFDSMTFLSKATMDRQMFINNRYGDVEDIADYRVVGSKLTDVFNSIAGMPLNIYATGHLSTFQDEKTKKISTQLNLPGKARNYLPLLFTDVWLAGTEEGEKGKDGQPKYTIRTRPDPRGLQEIRCSIPGLDVVEDVTIRSFGDLTEGGIGGLLTRKPKPAASVTPIRR